MEELRQDVKEIKTQVLELVKQGAVHNHLLAEHAAYSKALQVEQEKIVTRILPVEDSYKFYNRIAGIVAVVVAGGGGAVLVSYLLSVLSHQ